VTKAGIAIVFFFPGVESFRHFDGWLGILGLTFVFACIVSTITIDNQQDATIFIYLFLISSTCFGWRFRPSSGAYHCSCSFWYCPPKLLLAGVAHTKKNFYKYIAPKGNKYLIDIFSVALQIISRLSKKYEQTSPETCRADQK